MVVGYCLGLFVSSPASGQCPPSHYREGQVWENTVSSVFMTISIPLSEFAPNRMVCLAKVFERRYGSRKDVAIMIFSSRDSAVRYTPTPRTTHLRMGRRSSVTRALRFGSVSCTAFITMMPTGTTNI